MSPSDIRGLLRRNRSCHHSHSAPRSRNPLVRSETWEDVSSSFLRHARRLRWNSSGKRYRYIHIQAHMCTGRPYRTHGRTIPPSRVRPLPRVRVSRTRTRVYRHIEVPRRFCNMLLFGSSEYLRDRFLPLNHCRGPYRYWQPAGEIGGISGISDLSGIRICSGESIPLERVGLNSFLVSSFEEVSHARGSWLSHRTWNVVMSSPRYVEYIYWIYILNFYKLESI